MAYPIALSVTDLLSPQIPVIPHGGLCRRHLRREPRNIYIWHILAGFVSGVLINRSQHVRAHTVNPTVTPKLVLIR